jgi:hypothetical protein
MGGKTPSWETEFWSYLNQSDGIKCPIYEYCQYRLRGYRCICDDEGFFDSELNFLDDESFDPASFNITPPQLYKCLTEGRIFKLGIRLADKYRERIELHNRHVTGSLIIKSCDDIHIEVRLLPLRAHSGAVWRLSDCWVIYLNSDHTSARQRLTLHHEIFHILAHYYAHPVFKKSYGREGSFNELLAEHFAAVSLMPRNLIRERWKKVKDINQMATLFDVPKPVMYRGLQLLRMI